MSIIYDALKKVQKNITSESIPRLDTALSVKARHKTNPILILILLVCLVLTLANFSYLFFKHYQNIKSVKKELPPVELKTIPAPAAKETGQTPVTNVEQPVAPIAPAEPELALNGVFFEQGDGYALINNKIVQVGDQINHAKVKEITLNGVELEFEGKSIKLQSPS